MTAAILRDKKRGPGHPPHAPTDQTRATVKAMSAYGVPQVQIARVLDIHDETLRIHYRDELDLGLIEANAKVAETLFRQATKEGSTTAAIWWSKCRMGWREKHEVEYSGSITVASALNAATERLKKLGEGTQLNGSECVEDNECEPDHT
jgi:hypothetical protein